MFVYTEQSLPTMFMFIQLLNQALILIINLSLIFVSDIMAILYW